MAIILRIISYPVKGCAGTCTDRLPFTPAGALHDRTFMIVDPDGGLRSQRSDPIMAVIRPDLDAAGTRLLLSAPGRDPVNIDVITDGPTRPVTLFGRPYRGIDQGDRAATWLSDILSAPARLVRVPADHHRVTGGLTTGTAGYADGHAVLMASTASLAELNRRLAADGAPTVGMERFRPNLIVGPLARPHGEDDLRLVRIGSVELGYAQQAFRCAVTTVDQTTGARTGPEPLRCLAGYRRFDGGVAFGAAFAVTRPGVVAVGDELEVLEPNGSR